MSCPQGIEGMFSLSIVSCYCFANTNSRQKTTAKVITGKMTLVTEGEWPEPKM
jgi:hypothetical protein